MIDTPSKAVEATSTSRDGVGAFEMFSVDGAIELQQWQGDYGDQGEKDR